MTTEFGTARGYNGGPVSTHHSGTDFGVDEGTPVSAAAAGRVAFAGQLTTRGTSVIIDHGAGVFTAYHHLSVIEVTEGQDVAQGQEVALSGMTGLATGPHLHWELIVGGVNVDPVEWTYPASLPDVSSDTDRALRIYALLDAAYGNEHWHWMPDLVRGPLDIIAGAILVQHTTWQTAERALESLRSAGMLDIDALATAPEDQIAALVRIAGTPTIKARRLRAIATMIRDAGGIDAFLRLPLDEMRPLLLATHGVGPETADAIALYAAGRRTFVIDAYTIRLFTRLGIGPTLRSYEGWRRWFEEALPDADATLFQRYHAWIVLHCKARCRVRPLCDGCPLLADCAYGQSAVADA